MMKLHLYSSALVLSLALISGCATQQEVVVAKTNPKAIATVSQVREDGNSAAMDSHFESALAGQGLQIKAKLPAGTRKNTEVDAIASYVDVWRWDLTMYLQSISVRLFDASTGDLLATGHWKDSALHGFRDAKTVVDGLVTEMVTKLRPAAAAK